MTTETSSPMPDFERAQRLAVELAAACAVACAVAWVVNPARFFPSYLVAFLFWVGVSTGCLAVVMLHQLVGGIWGFVVRRPAEAGAMALPLMALLFIPIALGVHQLYPWADLDQVAANPRLAFKAKYLLNINFFLVRALIYFGTWSALAWVLYRGSSHQDEVTDPAVTERLQTISGPGLAIYFLTVTCAVMDWGMTLEPLWYSSIYGPMVLVGQVLGTLSLLVLISSRLSRTEPLSQAATPQGFHDLGNLMLAFTMLWAYMSFSQYLVSWSGNQPEEISWYLRRSRDGWRVVAIVLILFHFFAPFFVLLSRDRKRNAQALARVAIWILAMRVLDLVWLVIPSFSKSPAHPASPASPHILEYWAIVPAFLGIGGLWMAAFLARLKARPLLPRNDPLLAAALEHHGEGE
jgi:hypothetical protein